MLCDAVDAVMEAYGGKFEAWQTNDPSCPHCDGGLSEGTLVAWTRGRSLVRVGDKVVEAAGVCLN